MSVSPFVPDYHPSKLRRVTVEVTTWCNLKCPGCLRTIQENQGRWFNKHMTKDLFYRVVSNLPKAEIINLQGIGEPTLHPDYLEFCKIATSSEKFDHIYMNTNGLARDPEYYLELKEAGLTGFHLSVDSLTQEIANRVRTGTNVQKLAQRIRRLRDLGLAFSVAMVVSRANLRDVTTSLRALHDLGVSAVNMVRLIDFQGDVEPLDADDCARLEDIVAAAKIECAAMSIAFHNTPERLAPYCVAPWLDPGVTVDGYLTPCCVNLEPTTLGGINLGDITYEEAREFPSFREFILSYVEENPPFCQGCFCDCREGS